MVLVLDMQERISGKKKADTRSAYLDFHLWIRLVRTLVILPGIQIQN